MTATTEYGTWTNHASSTSLTPRDYILTAINGGDADWRARMETPGADGCTPLENIEWQYRAAINAALPADITLCGDQFYGPYPADENHADIASIITEIDLYAIVFANDPDLPDLP